MDLYKKSKPKLVEKKILKKAIKRNIKKSNIVVKSENKIFNNIKECFKENIGIIIVSIVLSFLLYLRYREVQNRRKKKSN